MPRRPGSWQWPCLTLICTLAGHPQPSLRDAFDKGHLLFRSFMKFYRFGHSSFQRHFLLGTPTAAAQMQGDSSLSCGWQLEPSHTGCKVHSQACHPVRSFLDLACPDRSHQPWQELGGFPGPTARQGAFVFTRSPLVTSEQSPPTFSSKNQVVITALGVLVCWDFPHQIMKVLCPPNLCTLSKSGCPTSTSSVSMATATLPW